jgi:hypothetical protein
MLSGPRDQANRLLAMALKARENGQIEGAEKLTELAAHYLDKAQTLDPVASQPRAEAPQQQQQPQPDSDKDRDKE